jgi:hypothetical protein
MSVLFEILATLALIAWVRRPSYRRGLLLAAFIFMGRLKKNGWFLVLVFTLLALRLLTHLLCVALQAATGGL